MRLDIVIILTFFVPLASCTNQKAADAQRGISSTADVSTVYGLVDGLNKARSEERFRRNDTQYFNTMGAACIESVCGKSSEVQTHTDFLALEKKAISFFNEKNSDFKRMRREFARYLAREVYHDRLNARALEAADISKEELSPSQVRLVNGAYAHMAYFAGRYAYMTDSKINNEDDDYVDVELEDIIIHLENKKMRDIDWLKKVLRGGFYKMAEVQRKNSMMEKLADLLSIKYPKVLYKDVLPRALADCRKDMRSILVANPTLDGLLRQNFLYCGSKKSPGNIVNEKTLLRELIDLGQLKLTVGWSIGGIINERKIDFEKEVFAYRQSRFYKEKNLIFRVTNEDIYAVAQEGADYCRKKIAASYHFAPSALSRKQTDSRINDIKSVAKDFFKFEDPISQGMFNRNLDKIHFSYLSDKKSLIRNILSQVKRRMGVGIVHDETLVNKWAIVNLLLLVSNVSSPGGGNMGHYKATAAKNAILGINDIKKICDQYSDTALSDHILTEEGASYLSWVTVSQPAVGMGIIAHEMGHYISQIMSKMGVVNKGKYYLGSPEKLKIWERRRCINQFHYVPVGSKVMAGRNGETFRTEEDWADYFAAQVVKKLKPKHPYIKNFGCTLLDKEKKTYKVNLVNHPMDPHSFDLFRILHIEKVMGGGVTKACSAAIENKMLPECF